MKVLVTGGLGYIGSNFCASLIEANIDFSIIDNLSNSSLEVLKRLNNLALRSTILWPIKTLHQLFILQP